MTTERVPPLDMLYALEQIAIYETDAAVQEETQIRANQHTYDKQLARKDPSHKVLHRKLRGAPTEQVTTLDTTVDQLACGVQTGTDQYAFYTPDPAKYDLNRPVEYDGETYTPDRRDKYALYAKATRAQGQGETTELPESASLKQTRTTLRPLEVAEELHDFWDTYWTRDPQDEPPDAAAWEPFKQYLSQAADLPTIDTKGATLEEWIEVQKATKPTAARGADAWTGPEIRMLPRAAVVDLKAIMDQMESWPEDIMVARTIPLPKKEAPTVKDVRPITILPMVYRWWARVVTKHMLRRLAAVLGREVTGMLAGQGRGATAASYATQAWIERSRHEARPSGGFILDLVKCYNQVPRPVAIMLLQRVGTPKQWTRKWKQALKDMSRTWQINHNISSPRKSTTGIPEGDPISCIAMVVLSALWCSLMRSEATSPSAYADNWGWKTEDETKHAPALRTTIDFTDSVRLPISFEKSTWWATDAAHERAWQALLKDTLPTEQIARVTKVIDLGNPLTFQGFVSSACMEERFHKAATKCTRLQRADEPPDTKAAILMRNIWPTAMYGAPLVMLPEGRLSSLRTKAADAVLGGPNTGNSAITLAFAGNHIADPELFYYTEAFREARRYLLAATTEDRAAFYRIIVASRNKAGKVWGPAGILAQILVRLTWTCNTAGTIGIGAFETFKMEETSFDVIKSHLRRAWENDLLAKHSVNPAYRNALPVDTKATWKAIQDYGPGEKAILLREITGAFQTQDRKAKWTHDATPQCEYCTEPDSILHRVLQCQAFSDTREKYETTVKNQAQKEDMSIILPVMHRDPNQDFLRISHGRHKELEIDPETQARADRMQTTPQWYVDGSCAYPEAETCYSTCAAILDTLETDPEREAAVRRMRHVEDYPDTFAVGGFARVPGGQHIYRAELMVVVRLMETQHRGHIWSDSQLVCNLVPRCRMAQTPEELQHLTHYDLVRRLWSSVQRTQITIGKVKAHQNRSQATSALEVYRSCGNDIADATAKKANLYMTPGLTQMYKAAAQEQIEDQVELKAHYDLRIALSRARMQGEDTTARRDQAETCDTRAGSAHVHASFVNWRPQAPRVGSTAESPDCAEFAYGPALGKALWTWVGKLHIGEQGEGPGGRSPGTTWLELAMGSEHGCQCDVNKEAKHGGSYPPPRRKRETSGVHGQSRHRSSLKWWQH